MKLKITNYRYVDTIAQGTRVYKKVIAQQLEQVLPNAVNTMTNVIPDIYKLAEIKNGVITVANTLKSGDKVKLIFANRKELVDVMEADANSFKVNLPDDGKVFVYGKQVNDFRTVDYDALTTLNISATQSLAGKVIALEEQNAALSELVENLQIQMQNLNAKVDASLAPVIGQVEVK